MGSNGVLLTGSTGFVGMQVLARWLEGSRRPVHALIRAPDQERADERLREVLETVLGDAERWAGRVTAVPGDLERDGLGMSRARREQLASQVGTIVHCAASVSFSLGLEDSRRINVGGTRRMLELAAACPDLERFTYVSTAYVAGDHDGLFGEADFDVDQDFRNHYERSKYEAEALVRAERWRLPTQILRPSIVVGERETGWTNAFNVLYTPLKAFSRGSYRVVPADLTAPVDVVPVDYVADAVYELSAHGGHGTYHLVAGGRATTVGRLAEMASTRFDQPIPRATHPALYRRVLHPLLKRLARGRARRALESTEVFFPYFAMKVRYGDRKTRDRLEPAGVEVPHIESYFGKLLDFAELAAWGRRALPRPAAAADS